MKKFKLADDGMNEGRILAWMYFPNDLELRQNFFDRGVALQKCDECGPDGFVTLPGETLARLITGPGSAEMKALLREATRRGTVAGDLLNLIYEMAVRDRYRPSFGKAVNKYKEFALRGKYGDGVALKRSEQTLRDYFNEFASVAHLWGAFRFNAGPFAYADRPVDTLRDPTTQRIFLGVARALGEFASTFVPLGTKPAKPVMSLS